jgi:DNA repair protein RadA/Sms
MARVKSRFVCNACGAQTAQWMGQCPDCYAWNSLVETPVIAAAGARTRGRPPATDASRIHDVAEVTVEQDSYIKTGIDELDRVLGGGLVPGSVVLLGGDPGIGKSTLLLQAVAGLNASGRLSCLYVTGEESPHQVALRGKRLGLNAKGLRLLAETHVEQVLALAEKERPGALVIDSIQTMYTDLLQSAPGSVAQVRESAAQFVRYAKNTGAAMLMVGHVTKEGALAGPRVLEHMVDAVLYFESERNQRYRAIRTVKNRFGAANELGIFAMTEAGLKAVGNPSAIFLSRHEEEVAGSAVTVTREGTRPLLLEGGRPRPHPAQHAAGGVAPSRGRRYPRPGCVHQRGGRGAHYRNRRRPAHADGGVLEPARPPLARRYGDVRRGGTVRRDPPGAAR